MVTPYIWKLLTTFATYNTVDDNIVSWASPHSIPDEALYSISNTAVGFTSFTFHHIQRNRTEFPDVTLNRKPSATVLHRFTRLWNPFQWNIAVTLRMPPSISPIRITTGCYLLPILDSLILPETLIVGINMFTLTTRGAGFLTTSVVESSLGAFVVVIVERSLLATIYAHRRLQIGLSDNLQTERVAVHIFLKTSPTTLF